MEGGLRERSSHSLIVSPTNLKLPPLPLTAQAHGGPGLGLVSKGHSQFFFFFQYFWYASLAFSMVCCHLCHMLWKPERLGTEATSPSLWALQSVPNRSGSFFLESVLSSLCTLGAHPQWWAGPCLCANSVQFVRPRQ